MLATLYKKPSTLQRHLEAPLLDEREQYLMHLSELGLKLRPLMDTASSLLFIIQELKLEELRDVELKEVLRAGARWAKRRRAKLKLGNTKDSLYHFTRIANKWLRFVGRLKVPTRPSAPFAVLLMDFAKALSDHGRSGETVKTYCAQTSLFLRWFAQRHRSFRLLHLEDVDDFLAVKGTAGWNRTSISTLARTLRVFFSYAEQRRWCVRGIAKGMLVPRRYKKADIPEGPSWEDVRRLLESVPGERAADIRARAVLTLLAVYGVRSGEISRLQLDHIDWRRRTFIVHRSKRGGVQQFPLTHEVGDAIVDYLTKARPRCAYPHVFVSLHIPYRPLTQQMVWEITNYWYKQVGIHCRHNGPHSLRHACATHLLREGSSYRELADFLGHRNPNSPRTYAQVDLSALRRVGDFSLEGLR